MRHGLQPIELPIGNILIVLLHAHAKCWTSDFTVLIEFFLYVFFLDSAVFLFFLNKIRKEVTREGHYHSGSEWKRE
jgi:hypothetical protein